MKQTYIKPQIELIFASTDSMVLASQPEGDQTDEFGAKGHGSFFDSWDSFEEEEQQSGFTNKSLWED